MNSERVIKTAKKLSAIAHNAFPHVDECVMREAIAKALISAIADREILDDLFDDDDLN